MFSKDKYSFFDLENAVFFCIFDTLFKLIYIKSNIEHIDIVKAALTSHMPEIRFLNNTIVEKGLVKRASLFNSEKTTTFENYLSYLFENHTEQQLLAASFHIHHSAFFRDVELFDHLSKIIIPNIINQKKKSGSTEIRIWSAGCAMGEEAYSIAIMLNEIQEMKDFEITIFATDSQNEVLENAKKALYSVDRFNNMNFSLIEKYIDIKGESYQLKQSILPTVIFEYFDLINNVTHFPEESIYGNFDIVFCCNVLMYYNQKGQEKILNKLHHSVAENGYLIIPNYEYSNFQFSSKYNNTLKNNILSKQKEKQGDFLFRFA